MLNASCVLWLKPCRKSEGEKKMVKTATFEALLEDARPDGEGGYLFTLEGKTYRLSDRDEVRKIAEQHGYIIIY